MSGAGSNISVFTDIFVDSDIFTCAFISIAGYYSMQTGSKPLPHIILSVLSVNQICKLKTNLSELQQSAFPNLNEE